MFYVHNRPVSYDVVVYDKNDQLANHSHIEYELMFSGVYFYTPRHFPTKLFGRLDNYGQFKGRLNYNFIDDSFRFYKPMCSKKTH